MVVPLYSINCMLKSGLLYHTVIHLLHVIASLLIPDSILAHFLCLSQGESETIRVTCCCDLMPLSNQFVFKMSKLLITLYAFLFFRPMDVKYARSWPMQMHITHLHYTARITIRRQPSPENGSVRGARHNLTACLSPGGSSSQTMVVRGTGTITTLQTPCAGNLFSPSTQGVAMSRGRSRP